MALETYAITLEALRGATPILLGTLGAIIGQRAGVLNLGLEGVVYLSAAVAAAVGPPWGFLVAVTVGTIYNLIYYLLANELALNQILLGFAFTMIGYGLGSQIAQGKVGQPIGKLTAYGLEFVITVAIAISVYFFFKTRLGIAIRASGDDPQSLDLMGVDVYNVRKIAGVLEGLLASSAGAYVILAYYGSWSELLPMGWGFLAVITAMISLWSPLLAIGASLIPSTFITLSYILQGFLALSPHLLNTVPYLVPIVLLAAIQLLVKRAGVRAAAPKWLARPYVREERA
ncbi:MAG: ABC transporter permease subunit [Pyrobaculum sp.]